MRIPILRLQIKTVTQEAFFPKGKQHVPPSITSGSLRMLPAELSLCVLRSNATHLLIGMCCACAVFGVCSDEYSLRNESTWVLFLDMLPFYRALSCKTGNQLPSEHTSSNQKSLQ